MVQFLLVERVADTVSALSGMLAARGKGLKAQDNISAERSAYRTCCVVLAVRLNSQMAGAEQTHHYLLSLCIYIYILRTLVPV